MREDWLDRWAEGRIGWHEQQGNAGLKRHWDATGKRVLVPLCGKSPDLLWLADRGNTVVGVELSKIAVESFFAENGLRYRRGENEWQALDKDITIHCGDFFEFGDRGFDGHYDRGALIALPRDRRPGYVARLNALLARDCYQLIVTLEYDQEAAEGPPFCVPADEVRAYWPDLERLDEREDIAGAPPKFRDAGLSSLTEVVWGNGSRRTV